MRSCGLLDQPAQVCDSTRLHRRPVVIESRVGEVPPKLLAVDDRWLEEDAEVALAGTAGIDLDYALHEYAEIGVHLFDDLKRVTIIY